MSSMRFSLLFSDCTAALCCSNSLVCSSAHACAGRSQRGYAGGKR